MKDEVNQKIYLKGYKEGFESALKMAWALAEDLYIKVPNVAKEDVFEFIKKIKN